MIVTCHLHLVDPPPLQALPSIALAVRTLPSGSATVKTLHGSSAAVKTLSSIGNKLLLDKD